MVAPRLKTHDSFDLYDQDFYTWTQDQADRLRTLAPQPGLDLERLAEEVAELGRSELGKTYNHLVHTCAHLLEAPSATSDEPQRHWRGEVVNQQRQARTAFTPGMRQKIDVAALWADAIRLANATLRDHGDAEIAQPPACAFTLEDLLAPDFDPDAALIRVKGTRADARDGG